MSVNFTATGAMLNGVPHCGWSALGCQQYDPHDPRRQVWDGKWPGEADCERLGFFVNDDPAFPDLNRFSRSAFGTPTRGVGNGNSKRIGLLSPTFARLAGLNSGLSVCLQLRGKY